MSRQIFVNLPVSDVPAAASFYEGLGFGRNEQFSTDDAVSIVVSDSITLILLAHDYFATFTPKPVGEPRKTASVLVAISAESRAEVDDLAERAMQTGASTANPPQDHGFMYGRSFFDLDGHQIELVWMDPAGAPQQ
ncbi:VOC family protein [Solicola sp. PLA-1-18]|jgi:predicted lactoylglutathione lyase|uniref:VOC family protein n=1 Tax=Solicola sp. PLA-1-18 TaxID=3380532 RepID=UPI003B822AC3